MLPDQRRHLILQELEKQGFASLSGLADHVGSSESTIRRDLEQLEGLGQIRRTRGGAAFSAAPPPVAPLTWPVGLPSRRP